MANSCALIHILGVTHMGESGEGVLEPEPRADLSVLRTRGTRRPRKSNRNIAFNRTLSAKLNHRQREALEHQFPARFPWTEGRWKVIMTNWHYTVRKCKTLRWLQSMQARHSPNVQKISPVKETQVIYALYHISLPRRIYVGQTLNTAYERFQQHVCSAKQIFRTGDTRDTDPFYRHMAHVGLQGFRIFPLEKIPGVFPATRSGRKQFRQTALVRETFWKRVLHAFLPTGLCLEGKKPKRVRGVRAAQMDTGDSTNTSTSGTQHSAIHNKRTYASRDFERKTRYLLNSAAAGRFTPVQNLNGHTTRNIRRMYDTLHSCTPEIWEVERTHFDTVSEALLGRLATPVNSKQFRSVIVQLFLHQDLERLGVNSIVADEETWINLVPRATRDRMQRPMLAYKFAPPISRTFCNYSKVSSISTEGCHKILSGPCQCKNPSFRKFQDKHTGHVITTDTSIMSNATLQSLMAKGTKFRCTVAEADLEGNNIHGMVQHDLERAFKTWSKGVRRRLGEADASALGPWKDFILSKALELVNRSDMLNNIPVSNQLPSENDLQQLSYVHRHFVITTVDKAENNFCIMCKKHYLLMCLQELEHGVAYKESDLANDEILLSCQQFDDKFRRSLNEPGVDVAPGNDLLRETEVKVPNFHIRVKMHKEPLGFRFVAGSAQAPLTNVSKWLTLILKAVTPTANELWRKVAAGMPGTDPTLTSWIITDSEEISHLCRSVNKPRTNRDTVPLAAYDFTTMYTKLCLSDLKARFASLIEAIFELKASTSRAKLLLVDEFGHFEWIVNLRVGLPNTTKVFDAHKIIEAISFLVDNTYVKFAGKIWHQIVGIPMGTNCAGFLANLYCFTYELDFLKRVVDDKNYELAQEMQRTKRYIDDLIAINCVLLPQKLYLPDGIYPPNILALVLAAEGETVPYMDLLIRQNRRRGLITAIYDKRLDDKYADINVIRYPDTQSILATKAKCGIVTSQMYRFMRRCTLAKDFVYNTSLVLHRLILKAYHTSSLWAQVRRFLVKHPHIYGGRDVRSWINRLRSKISALARGACKPGPFGQVVTC